MTLPINEITVLMAINAIGIMALMGMMVHLALVGILGNKKDDLSDAHFNRN